MSARRRVSRLNALLLLALAAGTVASAHADDPIVSNHRPPCTCKDTEALAKDLANTKTLHDRFLKESQQLDSKYAKNPLDPRSIQDESDFTARVAPRGITSPPGYTGPPESRYVPRGDWAGVKLTKEQKCKPDDASIDTLQRSVDGSVCFGMGEAIVAHEKVHYARCESVGYDAYVNRTGGAKRAREEADAYEAQGKVLERELKRVKPKLPSISRGVAYGFPGALLNMGNTGGCVGPGNDQNAESLGPRKDN